MQNFESIFIILKLFTNVLLSPTELTGFTLVPLDHNMKDGRKIEIRYTLFQPYDGRKKTIFLMEDPFDKYFLDGINLYGLENEFNLVQIKGRHNSDAILKILNSTGKTDWTKAYQLLNMDQHARDMELVRKELVGDQQINLLGFSGSAAYLHYYLSLYPEKVYSLISFNPLLFDLQKNLKLQDPANCMVDIALQNRLIAYLWYTFSGSFCPSTNESDRNDFQSYLFLKWGFILPALYSDKEEDAAMKVRLFEHSYGLLGNKSSDSTASIAAKWMKQESKVLWLEFEKKKFPVFGVNYDKGLHFKGKVLIVGSVYDKLLSRYCYDILAEFYPNSTLILVRDGHSQRKLWRFLFHYELIGSFINQDTQKKIAVFEKLQRKKLLYDNRDTSL